MVDSRNNTAMKHDYVRKSFLWDLLGVDNSKNIRILSHLYIGAYSVIYVIFLVISRYFYWEYFSSIFSLLTGTTIFALLFIAGFTIVLNFDVKFSNEIGNLYKETKEYKVTIVWGIAILITAIFIQYYLDVVTDHYEFQCGTYLVDIGNGIYHIKDCNCETINDASFIVEMRGFEIEENTTCRLCHECKYIVEDAIDTYESEMFYRK